MHTGEREWEATQAHHSGLGKRVTSRAELCLAGRLTLIEATTSSTQASHGHGTVQVAIMIITGIMIRVFNFKLTLKFKLGASVQKDSDGSRP